MSKHTKGELEIMSTGVNGGKDLMLIIKPNPNDPNVIVTVGRVFVNRRGENKANAKHLGKCWNSHDALLAACRDFLDGWLHFCDCINFDKSSLDADAIRWMNIVPGKIQQGYRAARAKAEIKKQL